MNVNQIVRIIPTLKVNNRKLNETFYMETLGMKVLLEESAFLSLGDQTGLAWEPWRTVYNRTDLPLVQKRTIINSGTTLKPKYDEKVENN